MVDLIVLLLSCPFYSISTELTTSNVVEAIDGLWLQSAGDGVGTCLLMAIAGEFLCLDLQRFEDATHELRPFHP